MSSSLHNQSCDFSALQSCSLFPPSAGSKRGRPDSSGCSMTSTAPPRKKTVALSSANRITSSSSSSSSLTSSKVDDPHKNTTNLHNNIDETIDNPVDFLKALFSSNETTKAWMEDQQRHNQDYAFSKPTPDELAHYDLAVVKAVRERNLSKVKEMLHVEGGRRFHACNRFGESLIHMACRRGDRDMVAFLLDDAHVTPDVCDDFGRRPLHDALWTSQPNVEVVRLLLQKVPPRMLLVEDVRGHTPFQYARREHWPIWVAFLREHADVIVQRVLQAVPRTD